ncbi:MAG TPA: ectoine/hydroxyectoine ABC transporter permease subunit EhuD [Bauldia sp.]|nr:ectoine/hydroxyectoine ABC transporter permease subunit EhuD [Bauldia sp.]
MPGLFDWAFAWRILPILLQAAVVTLHATFLGFALALALGLVLALIRRSGPRWAQWIVVGLVEFIRSTPVLVQVFFLFFIGPRVGIVVTPLVAGVLALGLHFGCLLSEVYRAGLDSVPRGQWEAPLALNMSRYRIYRDVILPQAIPPMIPAMGNYLVAMFKETPLLSSIGLIELMARAKLIGAETFRYLEPITMVGVFFLVMSLVAAAAITGIETWANRRLHRA